MKLKQHGPTWKLSYRR